MFSLIAAVVLSVTLATPGGVSPAVAASPGHIVPFQGNPTLPNEQLSPTEPPFFVYRLDTRPPEEIFRTGFEPWADDVNLIRHVNGNPFSAYVSTTSDPAMYREFAPITFDLDGITDVWVYTIRATSNFYNTAGSLDYLRQLPGISPDNRALAERTYRDFERQHEWSALGGIPRTQILQAGRLNRDVLANAPDTASVISLLQDSIPNTRFYVIDSTRGNFNLITNENYTGIQGSNLASTVYGASWFGNCTAPRSTRAEACALGGFSLRPRSDPYDGKKFAFRPKLAYSTAVDMNASVQMYDASENAPQVFTPEAAPGLNGYYRLKNAQTGRFLTFTETGYGAATTRTLVGADSSANPERMFWKFERQADGWFLIVSRDGEKLITRNLDGGLTVINPGGSPRDQDKWNVAPIGGIPMTHDRIAPVQSTAVLGAGSSPGVPHGSAITLRTPYNNPGMEQRWFYQYHANAGAYLIGNVKSTTAPGVYLVIARSSTATPPTAVEMAGGGYSDQYWIVRKNPSGFYEFLNYDMAKSADGANTTVYALDLPAPTAGLGTAVGAHPYQGGTNQQWWTCSMARYDSTSCEP